MTELVERVYSRIAPPPGQLTTVRARGKELDDQLATTRRNRRQPPSREGAGRQRRRVRTASGKKSGGQAGPRGTTLPALAVPEQRVPPAPVAWAAWGPARAAVAGRLPPERRPVCDRPPLGVAGTDPRVGAKDCAAWGAHKLGAVPATVLPGPPYGAGSKGRSI